MQYSQYLLSKKLIFSFLFFDNDTVVLLITLLYSKYYDTVSNIWMIQYANILVHFKNRFNIILIKQIFFYSLSFLPPSLDAFGLASKGV